jgi:hypothetical protein
MNRKTDHLLNKGLDLWRSVFRFCLGKELPYGVLHLVLGSLLLVATLVLALAFFFGTFYLVWNVEIPAGTLLDIVDWRRCRPPGLDGGSKGDGGGVIEVCGDHFALLQALPKTIYTPIPCLGSQTSISGYARFLRNMN